MPASPLPLFDHSLEELFTIVTPTTFVDTLTCTLLEHQVLLLSKGRGFYENITSICIIRHINPLMIVVIYDKPEVEGLYTITSIMSGFMCYKPGRNFVRGGYTNISRIYIIYVF